MKLIRHYWVLFFLAFLFVGPLQAQTPGQALDFDGTTNYVSIGNLGNVDNWTIELWFKPKSLRNYENLFHSEDQNINRGIRLEISQNWRSGHFYVSVAGTNVFTPATIVPLSADLSLDWHHLAIVGDKANNKLFVYLDGEKRVDKAQTNWPTTFPNFVLGRGYSAGAERNFSGTIDEFRIWNTARTSDQVLALKDTELNGNEPGLLAYYNFNQGIAEGNNASEIALKAQAGNVDGTLKNFALSGTTSNWTNSTALIKAAAQQNVAKGKTARQSTTPNEPLGGASKAVDGNTSGTWLMSNENTITSTLNGEVNPWWEVDLGSVYDISEIRIWNRTDACCWHILKDLYIMVSEVPIKANSTTANQYGSGPLLFPSAAEAVQAIQQPAKGRFVRIFKQNNSQLSLAEVEVMGTLAYNPATAGKKFIATNPDPIDEGVWFVIQNKSDVDTDFGIPARRLALKANGSAGAPVMAAIPLTGNFDEFLWRTVRVNGGFKLINKQLGENFALDCSQQNPIIGNIEEKPSQQWFIERSNTSNHGTNVYTLSNGLISNSKALQYANEAVTIVGKNANNAQQCWVFQPMDLVEGYLIPRGGAYGFDRSLSLPYGYQLVASNTVTDWGMLNAHLIYKNMLNALLGNQSQKIQNSTGKKIVVIISKDDPSTVDINTPYLYPNYTTEYVAKYRGGVSGAMVLITEEVMCTPGGPVDETRREFDQVVHEMAHAFDNLCELKTKEQPLAIADPSFLVQPQEWFPWKVQNWCNSAYSTGSTSTRKVLNAQTAAYLSTVFNPNNSWISPRWLRDR